mgnify:CR=1 FL=1
MGEISLNRPPRLMVACIGSDFMEGVADSVKRMVEHFAQKTGGHYNVVVQESLIALPPLGLGAMRNFQVMRAVEQDYDYLMLLDNDVLLEDPLIAFKLITRNKPYIVPWFDQSGLGNVHRIADPMYERDQGLLQLAWTTPFCNLIEVNSFRLTGLRPFSDNLLYCEDEYNSQFFRVNGVSIWQDTDVHVKLLRGPTMLWEHLKELKPVKPKGTP